MEDLTGKRVPDADRGLIMHGPDEQDLVHSGLEETMISATHEIMQVWKDNPSIPDMRTAGYVCAINKVATSYMELGIFP
jgi:glutamate dehydrogenase (NAD(P)+)